MQKKFCLTIIFFIFIIQTSFANETITLVNGEWNPYTSEALKHYGVFSHIVTESFASEGVQVNYVFMPWKRAYLMAKKGKYDGSLAWAPTEERKTDFYFSDPVINSKKVFFHLKSNDFNWETISDLKSCRVGATSQYTYGKEFDEAAKNNLFEIQYITYDKQNIYKLLHNRIDIFPMEIEVGYTYIHSLLIPEQVALITNHPKAIMETPFCLILSKKINKNRSTDLMKKFNLGLTKLKKSGRFEKMIWDSRQGKYKKK